MFTIYISNGYQIANKDGSFTRVERERFTLSMEEGIMTTEYVFEAIFEHYKSKDRFDTYYRNHLYLTDVDRKLIIKYLPVVDITDYGVGNKDTLYLASEVR